MIHFEVVMVEAFKERDFQRISLEDQFGDDFDGFDAEDYFGVKIRVVEHSHQKGYVKMLGIYPQETFVGPWAGLNYVEEYQLVDASERLWVNRRGYNKPGSSDMETLGATVRYNGPIAIEFEAQYGNEIHQPHVDVKIGLDEVNLPPEEMAQLIEQIKGDDWVLTNDVLQKMLQGSA